MQFKNIVALLATGVVAAPLHRRQETTLQNLGALGDALGPAISSLPPDVAEQAMSQVPLIRLCLEINLPLGKRAEPELDLSSLGSLGPLGQTIDAHAEDIDLSVLQPLLDLLPFHCNSTARANPPAPKRTIPADLGLNVRN